MSNEQDPWGRKPQKEPPDLDELFRKFRKKIIFFFGGKKAMQAFTGERQPSGWWFAGIIVVLVLFAWILSGIFIVSPAERSAVLRFGKYKETVGPGPHWIPRFIDANYKVNVQSVKTYPYTAEMLTKDENIVSVALAVQYRVDNVRNYLFNAVNPNVSLRQATASALRQVVGAHALDEVLTTGREQIREQIVQQLKKILERYHVGLIITDVALQPAKPPEAVTEAFDDVNKAREDEQRFINQATAYQQKVEPIAQGKAKRILQEANAYKQQVVLQAKAATVGFLVLLPQYKRAPKVMRERLYLRTMESILTKSSKVFVDVKGGGSNILYLPLDKLFMHGGESAIRIPK